MATTTTQPAPASTSPRTLTGTLIGQVVSDKQTKTRTVKVSYSQRHPKYGKYLHRDTRYHVHDEHNACKLGDRVEIAPCRPFSKTKTWRLVKVVEAALPPIDAIKNPEGSEAEVKTQTQA